MTTAIVYFTGTGNSLAVARLLADSLGGVELLAAKELVRGAPRVIAADAVGFVFPVYCQDAPDMVRRAAALLSIPAGAYVFAVVTHNGDPGYSHFTLDRELRRQGRRLSAGFEVLMPGNCITPKDSTNSTEERERRIRDAPARVAAIITPILGRVSRSFAGSNTVRKRLKGLRNRLRFRVVHRVPEQFWATDACTGCGLCMRLCPEGNIQIERGAPLWDGRCQMCLACLHWCPAQAVQNGSATVNRERYHHPAVTVEDILCSAGAPGAADRDPRDGGAA